MGSRHVYLDKVKDPAGTGDTMYKIWYGEETQLQANPVSHFATAKTAWLAVPSGAAEESTGTLVSINASATAPAKIYGRPRGTDFYQIGDAPTGAIFVSAYTAPDDSGNLWYEINYNHRQAWVPATEVTVVTHVG